MTKTKQEQAEYSFHPKICHLCGSSVELVSKKDIHPSSSSKEKVYRCSSHSCDAYVGCRNGTSVAIGSLASPETRIARREAHAAMAALINSGRMSKAEAYEWMQHLLGLPYNRRGIAWLRQHECRTLAAEIRSLLDNSRAESARKGIAVIRALFNTTNSNTASSANKPRQSLDGRLHFMQNQALG